MAYPAQAVFFRGLILERRTEERYPVRLPIRVEIHSDAGEPVVEDCILLNVSVSGLYMLLVREIPVGSRVVLDFGGKEGNGAYRLRGRVVRSDRRESDGQIGTAVRLEEPLDLHFARELSAP